MFTPDYFAELPLVVIFFLNDNSGLHHTDISSIHSSLLSSLDVKSCHC